jgi:hypothetical protein
MASNRITRLREDIHRSLKKAVYASMVITTQRRKTVTLWQLDRVINNKEDGRIFSRSQISRQLACRSSDHPDYNCAFEDLYFCIRENGQERWGLRKHRKPTWK